MCGEHSYGERARQDGFGSSPRVRGTRAAWGGAGGGITVHPRVCGEHHGCCVPASTCAGSSPRVRGTLSRAASACARKAVHPRVCGEHARRLQPWVPSTTVHPRVCGEHLVRCNWHLPPFRFIPACAGNTHRPANLGCCVSGSSPRVRGTPVQRLVPSVDCRFIPACAGNTCSPNVYRPWLTVHPRVCGEHIAICASSRGSGGSSPRVRGTRHRARHRRGRRRFIPACAGNTCGASCTAVWFSVHPRVCGEHHFPASCPVGIGGSSPRVRGTRRARPAYCRSRRFIPACAGNTTG